MNLCKIILLVIALLCNVMQHHAGSVGAREATRATYSGGSVGHRIMPPANHDR